DAVFPYDGALFVPLGRGGHHRLFQRGVDGDAEGEVTLLAVGRLCGGTAFQNAVGPVPAEPAGDEERHQDDADDRPCRDASTLADGPVGSGNGSHGGVVPPGAVTGSVASAHRTYPLSNYFPSKISKRNHSIRGEL